ncbi:DUF6883 domain-containing protein [Acidithiobacillus ferriphilus]|nr:DUF6883 domain-containing protein [Acidithiobacillus ferriphilus]
MASVTRWILSCSNREKSAIVRTGWIIRTGEDVPRLTSCYVMTS